MVAYRTSTQMHALAVAMVDVVDVAPVEGYQHEMSHPAVGSTSKQKFVDMEEAGLSEDALG